MMVNCIALDAGSARVVKIIGTGEIINTRWPSSPPKLGAKSSRVSHGQVYYPKSRNKSFYSC